MNNFTYKTNVVLLDTEEHHGDWMPTNLNDAIEWLCEKSRLIPDEFRSHASINIGSGSSYDSPYATITIEYNREPTEAEISARRLEALGRAERDAEHARKNAEISEKRAQELRAQ